jgi:hypothetical protein
MNKACGIKIHRGPGGRPTRPALSADKIAELRRRVADPNYLHNAIDQISEDCAAELLHGFQDLPPESD